MARKPAVKKRQPDQWDWVEKKLPGARAAWERDVRLPIAEFGIGTTGAPTYAIATDNGCYDPAYTGCRCRKFVDGAWIDRPHKPVAEWVAELEAESKESR